MAEEEQTGDMLTTPEGAIATLGIVLKSLGGEVRVSRETLSEGFVEGDYVDVAIDEDGVIVVSIQNNG